MSNAFIGHGTQFQRGDGNDPESFTTIAEVLDISEISETAALVEVTSLESPGGRREYIHGLEDGAEITIQMNFVPDDESQVGLREDKDNRVKRNFRILWPDTNTTSAAFTAIVIGFSVTTPIDDKVTVSVTLKITSPITWS